MLITIAIPCYKSSKTIGPVVEGIFSEFASHPGYDCQIVLVNDGSPDQGQTWQAISVLAAADSRITLVAPAEADVILLATGEKQQETGEDTSKAHPYLNAAQLEELRSLRALGKPVAVVLFCGRPMEVAPILPSADALLVGWFLGDASGAALADLLTGKVNPSGKLAMSIPVSVGQIPVHYNSFRTGRPYRGLHERYVSRYLDCDNEPLFPFGFGLSYAQFRYSDFSVETVEGAGSVRARAQVRVTNVSDRPGKETVQLYIHDVAAQVVRPVKELKGFRKLELQPGQKEEVSFDITEEMLSYWNEERQFIFEPGDFDIMLGSSSADVQSARVRIS